MSIILILEKVIIIRHGEYLTAYSNLHDVSVKMGEKIKTKDIIGHLSGSQNVGYNLLGFQIWKNRKVHPRKFLPSLRNVRNIKNVEKF